MKFRNGFSLIEVSLAIFVISIGLLSLFALFPAGLKEGEAGHADTQTSLFADYVLGTVRANAAFVGDPNDARSPDWDDYDTNKNSPKAGRPSNALLDYFFSGLPNSIQVYSLKSFEFPEKSKLYVRYYIDIVRHSIRNQKGEIISFTNVYEVRLWVQSGEYGTTDLEEFKGSAEMYYTELFFSGMP